MDSLVASVLWSFSASFMPAECQAAWVLSMMGVTVCVCVFLQLMADAQVPKQDGS